MIIKLTIVSITLTIVCKKITKREFFYVHEIYFLCFIAQEELKYINLNFSSTWTVSVDKFSNWIVNELFLNDWLEILHKCRHFKFNIVVSKRRINTLKATTLMCEMKMKVKKNIFKIKLWLKRKSLCTKRNCSSIYVDNCLRKQIR